MTDCDLIAAAQDGTTRVEVCPDYDYDWSEWLGTPHIAPGTLGFYRDGAFLGWRTAYVYGEALQYPQGYLLDRDAVDDVFYGSVGTYEERFRYRRLVVPFEIHEARLSFDWTDSFYVPGATPDDVLPLLQEYDGFLVITRGDLRRWGFGARFTKTARRMVRDMFASIASEYDAVQNEGVYAVIVRDLANDGEVTLSVGGLAGWGSVEEVLADEGLADFVDLLG